MYINYSITKERGMNTSKDMDSVKLTSQTVTLTKGIMKMAKDMEKYFYFLSIIYQFDPSFICYRYDRSMVRGLV